jgi:hypothetical protein
MNLTFCVTLREPGEKTVRVYKTPPLHLNRLIRRAEAFHCVNVGIHMEMTMWSSTLARYPHWPLRTIDSRHRHFNKVGGYMFDALCNDEPAPLLKSLRGRQMRRENCNGFYDYSDGKDQTPCPRTRHLSRVQRPYENRNPTPEPGQPASSFLRTRRPAIQNWRAPAGSV